MKNDDASVLLVEDDRTLRQTVVSAVQRAGYHVTAVADGLAAASALREHRFDVVQPPLDGMRVTDIS